MSPRLPDFVDPWRLADAGKRFDGAVRLEELKRLCAALVDCDGEAVFELAFHRDLQRRAVIEGKVRASLSLECQRCLEVMEHKVDSTFQLAVIEVADEADRIPEQYEPVQADEGQISPLALIEDELLLSIPQVPMHERAFCQAESGNFPDKEKGPDETEEKGEANPFAVLAALKTDETD